MKRFHEKHTNQQYRDRRAKVTLREKRTSYTANNSQCKEVAVYHTDDGQHQNNKRCDYAIYIFDEENSEQDDDRVIFVELKGSNIEHAIKQIDSTLQAYITDHNLNPCRIDARVVATRVRNPKYYSTIARRLKQKLNKYGKGTFEVNTKSITEEV